MKISGFSFVRNGSKLYYPVKESIESMLPLCDEIYVAVGQGDPDDTSREDIASIGSDKIHIIDTVWDERYMVRGAIHAIQTDIAMKACSGDSIPGQGVALFTASQAGTAHRAPARHDPSASRRFRPQGPRSHSLRSACE